MKIANNIIKEHLKNVYFYVVELMAENYNGKIIRRKAWIYKILSRGSL